MKKGTRVNARQTALAVLKVLQNRTDETKPIHIAEIVKELERPPYEISTNRDTVKRILDDLQLPAFNHIKKIFTVDKFKEAFHVQQIVRREAPSGCYQHILDRYEKSHESLAHIPITFIQADLLETVRIPFQCDNVTQFGLLGLCPSKEHYFRQLDQFVLLMNPGAVFIGANWVLSQRYSLERRLDNRYIKVGLIKEWAETRGRTLLAEKAIQIQNDENYDSVLVYAFV